MSGGGPNLRDNVAIHPLLILVAILGFLNFGLLHFAPSTTPRALLAQAAGTETPQPSAGSKAANTFCQKMCGTIRGEIICSDQENGKTVGEGHCLCGAKKECDINKCLGENGQMGECKPTSSSGSQNQQGRAGTPTDVPSSESSSGQSQGLQATSPVNGDSQLQRGLNTPAVQENESQPVTTSRERPTIMGADLESADERQPNTFGATPSGTLGERFNPLLPGITANRSFLEPEFYDVTGGIETGYGTFKPGETKTSGSLFQEQTFSGPNLAQWLEAQDAPMSTNVEDRRGEVYTQPSFLEQTWNNVRSLFSSNPEDQPLHFGTNNGDEVALSTTQNEPSGAAFEKFNTPFVPQFDSMPTWYQQQGLVTNDITPAGQAFAPAAPDPGEPFVAPLPEWAQPTTIGDYIPQNDAMYSSTQFSGPVFDETTGQWEEGSPPAWTRGNLAEPLLEGNPYGLAPGSVQNETSFISSYLNSNNPFFNTPVYDGPPSEYYASQGIPAPLPLEYQPVPNFFDYVQTNWNHFVYGFEHFFR